MTADRVTGVVLAAGRSSRLGTPKQLLPYDGTTLLGATLRVALAGVDPSAAGIVLMLGDQPRIQPSAVARLIAGHGASSVAVCRYSDGIGHPFWLGRGVFGDLARLHGDKGVWKLVEKAATSGTLTEVPVDSAIPLDVDTWDDYERLLDSATRSVPK
jgi:molybdenum cofactor cytidylyltransferase